MNRMYNEILIGSSIRKINAKINSDLRERFKDSEFTIPQIMFLRILRKHGEMKLIDISKEMDLANSTVSGIADRLEKQEFIIRFRDKEDKRVVHIKLTDAGEEAVSKFRGVINEYFKSTFGDFNEDDLNIILKAFDLIKGSLKIN